MAGKLPVISGRDTVRVFGTFGWPVARQSSSHIVMTKPGEAVTLSIPDHKEVEGHAAGVDPRGGTNCRRIHERRLTDPWWKAVNLDSDRRVG